MGLITGSDDQVEPSYPAGLYISSEGVLNELASTGLRSGEVNDYGYIPSRNADLSGQ